MASTTRTAVSRTTASAPCWGLPPSWEGLSPSGGRVAPETSAPLPTAPSCSGSGDPTCLVSASFDDPHVPFDGFAGPEIRKVVAQMCAFDRISDLHRVKLLRGLEEKSRDEARAEQRALRRGNARG